MSNLPCWTLDNGRPLRYPGSRRQLAVQVHRTEAVDVTRIPVRVLFEVLLTLRRYGSYTQFSTTIR